MLRPFPPFPRCVQVQYVLFKVLGVDERGAVTSTRCKLILAQWIGPEVPRMKRMHASASKKAISEYFQGACAHGLQFVDHGVDVRGAMTIMFTVPTSFTDSHASWLLPSPTPTPLPQATT